MKFKLDENVPREIADDLRAFGQQTDTVIEEGLQGAEDRLVVAGDYDVVGRRPARRSSL